MESNRGLGIMPRSVNIRSNSTNGVVMSRGIGHEMC